MDGSNIKKLLHCTEEISNPIRTPVLIGGQVYVRTQQDVRRTEEMRLMSICKVTPTGDIISMDGQNYDEETRLGILNAAAQFRMQTNNIGNSSANNSLVELLARMVAIATNTNGNNNANNFFSSPQSTNAIINELLAKINANNLFQSQQAVNTNCDNAIAELLAIIILNQSYNNSCLLRNVPPQINTDGGLGSCIQWLNNRIAGRNVNTVDIDEVCVEPAPIVAPIERQLQWNELPNNSSAPFAFNSDNATSTTELCGISEREKVRERCGCKKCIKEMARQRHQATNTDDEDLKKTDEETTCQEKVNELSAC